jgi:hypothetical protein
MDFIFEDDNDEVGSDIEAYCPKCKADTAHTVITKYEEEVRRVQCSPCGDVHAYRKPRGEVEDDVPEPASAKKRALAKKPAWQEFMDKAGNKAIGNARPYSIRDHYKENDIVTHPKFGHGFVTDITENKVEVTFQDERRILIHNRPDLAAQMPAIASIPAPREDKKGKRGKKGAAPPVLKGKGGKVEPVVLRGKGGKPVVPPAPPAKAPGKVPAKVAPPPPPPAAAKAKVQGKAERAKAAVAKKGAAKGKPAASAKPAARRPTPAKAKRPARPVARATKKKPVAKVKAKKAR